MADNDLLTAEEAQARLEVNSATFWHVAKHHKVLGNSIPLRGERVLFRPEDLAKLSEPRKAVEKAS